MCAVCLDARDSAVCVSNVVPPQPVIHLHALVLPRLGAMSVSVEHCQLVTKVGQFADASWKEHGRFIAGDLAFESVHLRSVEMSHPALPIFAYYLGILPMTSNGACVELWGSPDPVCLCILNVNHSQTRKSRLTAQAEALSSHIDSACNEVLSAIWDAKGQVCGRNQCCQEAETCRARGK